MDVESIKGTYQGPLQFLRGQEHNVMTKHTEHIDYIQTPLLKDQHTAIIFPL